MIKKVDSMNINIVTEKRARESSKTVSRQDNTHIAKEEAPAYILEPICYNKILSKEDANKKELEPFSQKVLDKGEQFSTSVPNDSLHERVEWHGPESGEQVVSSYLEYVWMLKKMGKTETIKEFGLDKYINVADKIEKGGKKSLLEYNLMFAGMAAYYSDRTTDLYAEKYIENGVYSQKEYDKVKAFASQLQDKAGVFVSAVFYDDAAHGQQVSSTYLGALCCIGVEKLGFMAEHRDADEIWVKLAQGAYGNEGELLQALRDGGYADTAEEYLKEYGLSEEKMVDIAFENEDGSLWDYTVGGLMFKELDRDAFRQLKLKCFGTEDVHVTYNSKQLDEAYKNGKKEIENLKDSVKNAGSGEDDEETEEERIKKQIETLRKKIRQLNQQIREIRNTALVDEKKSTMTEKFEKQVQTVQMQINDLLNRLAEIAKGKP